MTITRREMCFLIPAVLLPSADPRKLFPADDGVLPSATYPFDKLPVRASSRARAQSQLGDRAGREFRNACGCERATSSRRADISWEHQEPLDQKKA
jgi:hypothetical protein